MSKQSADAPISENQMEIKTLGVNIRLHNFPMLPAVGDAPATPAVADDYDDGLLSSAIHKVIDECNAEAEADRFVNVGRLREVIADLSDEMEVIMRVEGNEGASQMLAHVVSAIADAGCGEVEALMLDGFDSDVDFEEGTTVRTRADLAPKTEAGVSVGVREASDSAHIDFLQQVSPLFLDAIEMARNGDSEKAVNAIREVWSKVVDSRIIAAVFAPTPQEKENSDVRN